MRGTEGIQVSLNEGMQACKNLERSCFCGNQDSTPCFGKSGSYRAAKYLSEFVVLSLLHTALLGRVQPSQLHSLKQVALLGCLWRSRMTLFTLFLHINITAYWLLAHGLRGMHCLRFYCLKTELYYSFVCRNDWNFIVKKFQDKLKLLIQTKMRFC